MSYQILVLDLDGTLTNSNKEITPATKAALIEIQKNGKTVILASGRPDCGVLPLARDLKLMDFGGYTLSFNGARITECSTGSLLYNRTLLPDLTRPLFEFLQQYRDKGIDIIGYAPDHFISGFGASQYSQIEARINQLPLLPVDDFPSHITSPANKFLITGEPELIIEVKDALTSIYHSALSIYCSEPYFLEIMPQNVDKAHSLHKLLTSLGLTAEEMICCGDGFNDITMIEYAGLGVAMANAQPDLLERADYVTGSNNDDGIIQVINRFMRS